MHPDASEPPARGPGPNASDLSWQRASRFSLEPGHRPPVPTTTSSRSITKRLLGGPAAQRRLPRTTGSMLPVTPSPRLTTGQSIWRVASLPSGCERWGLHPFCRSGAARAGGSHPMDH
jgi:hypothetical protein